MTLDINTISESTDGDPAESMRYVYIERPRCPLCDSVSLKTVHSEDQNDGSVKRDTRCRDCGHRFFVVVE